MPQHDKHDNRTSTSGNRISPISLQKHLKGTSYPASKEDLVRKARANAAPDDVLQMIQQLPQHMFGNPTEVMRAFGQAQ
jgi:hypothetical protein